MSLPLQCFLPGLCQVVETTVNLKRSVFSNFIQFPSYKQKDSLAAKIYQMSWVYFGMEKCYDYDISHSFLQKHYKVLI